MVKNLGTYFPAGEPETLINIKIIDSIEEAEEAVIEIRKLTEKYRIIGFSSLRLTEHSTTRWLQLSTSDGTCFIMRLFFFFNSRSLSELIGDTSIIKVGHTVVVDAKCLAREIGLIIRCFVDVTEISKSVVGEEGKFETISAKSLGIVYDDNERLVDHSRSIMFLTAADELYAAYDAFLPLKVLEYCMGKIAESRKLDLKTEEDKYNFTLNYCKKYMMFTYTSVLRELTPRTPYYDPENPYNLYCMLGPDDQYIGMCTYDKKRQFLDRGIAYENEMQPQNVYFLDLSPEVLAFKEEWAVYGNIKRNGCAICHDNSKAFMKKQIVPEEYTNDLPPDMKTKLERDAVLICACCEPLFNHNLSKLRLYFSGLCSTSIYNSKSHRSETHGEISKIYARQLLNSRSDEFCPIKKLVIRLYYNEWPTAIKVRDMAYPKSSPIMVEHGKIVTDYFMKNGNLDKFGQMFIDNFMELHPENYPPK